MPCMTIQYDAESERDKKVGGFSFLLTSGLSKDIRCHV